MSQDYDKGYRRAIWAMRNKIETFDGYYDGTDAEIIQDFANRRSFFKDAKLEVDTYDSDTVGVKDGIRAALNELKAEMNKEERPTDTIVFRW